MAERNRSLPLDLGEFEVVDWDDEDDLGGNLAHCMDHGIDQDVVQEVLMGNPVDVDIEIETAEYALVGPDESGHRMWTLLFARSWKRGDWLRPVTGWPAKPREIREWESSTGETWRGGWNYD